MRALPAFILGSQSQRGASRRPAVVEEPRLSLRVKTALRRWSLDRELAHGADPASSPLLAYRAAQLTSDTERARSMRSLRAAASAGRNRRWASSAIPTDREEVALASRFLVIVEALLGSAGPVYAQGMAMLRCLLSDAASPLYSPGYRGALSDELELIIAALQGRPAR